MGCNYCSFEEQLDNVCKEWILEHNLFVDKKPLSLGVVIVKSDDRNYNLSVELTDTPIMNNIYLSEKIPIEYCPICGRKLNNRRED